MTNESPGSRSQSLVRPYQAKNPKPHHPPGTWFGACLLLSLLAFTPARPAHAAEWRAFWVDAWGPGLLNQGEVDTLLGVPGTTNTGRIRDVNCNAVFVQVRRRYDVCYPSGLGEPYFTANPQLSPTNFNSLQAIIDAAHDTTGGKKRIEVHCWQVTFATATASTTPSPVYYAHRDPPTGSLTSFDNYWPTRDNTGAETSDKAFDPGHPLMLQYIVNATMDMVNNFDIDGVHYDYIRFTAQNQGYNPTSIARYNARYATNNQPITTDARFKQWRRDQVTAVVRQVYARIQKSKPWVKQSGSFVTWNPSPTNSTRGAFQATRPYGADNRTDGVFSDWDSWIQEGIVDMAVPMTYYRQHELPNDYIRWMNFEKDRKFNRHMIIGPGVYMNYLTNAILHLQMTRTASPAGNYADGFSGYSYRSPYLITPSPLTYGDWTNFAPRLLAEVTPTWADIPDMPWKTSPTAGHMMGTVTILGTGVWADGAAVNITGPVSRTQTNDGTGFYAFIDLPPGSYTVVASKNGYPNATGTVAVAVGEVTGNMYERNLALGSILPSITTQPQDQNVNQTSNAVFSVVATSTPAPSYQWRYNGVDIGGATDSTYTRNNAQPADAGSYSVVVSNIAGTVTSTDALLTLNVAPAITTQPADRNVNQSSNAVFSVVATGTPAPAYQWRFNGTNISGATDSSHVLANAQPANVGSYSVVVSNVAGTATSTDALLVVNVAPEITAQPQSTTAAVGSNVTFTVTATGTAPLTYQWRFNGTNLAYATASAYTCWNAQTTHAGAYSVVVSNIAGTDTSTDAVLTVTQPAPPQIEQISIGSDGQVQLLVSGAPGRYAVEATTNLVVVDWIELTNFTTTGSTFQYLDSDTNQPQRFYRIRQW